MTAEYLAQHVTSLARQRRIEVHYGACSGAGPGFVEIERIVDERTYAIALHELGHVVCPCDPSHPVVQLRPLYRSGDAYTRTTTLTDGRVLPGVVQCLVCELLAWQWAIDTAISAGPRRWTQAMQDAMVAGLDTHLRAGTHRADELRGVVVVVGRGEQEVARGR